MVTEVLAASYETLITKDYGAKLLEEALPLITRPSPDLLTCGTWYVVLHPETQDLVLAAAVGPRRNRQNEGSHPRMRHFATHTNGCCQAGLSGIKSGKM